MLVTAAFALFTASFVSAQSTSSDNSLGISAIKAHFTQSGLVPSLLPSFNPSGLLGVTFTGVGAISPGQSLTETQVAPTPLISVTPANSSESLQGTYTLVMADADIVGTDESVGQTRHWLVNNVTVSGTGTSAPYNVSTEGSIAVTEYAGPAPKAGSGPHRYVILLLPQPSTFSPPANLTQPNIGVSVFHLTDYISASNLGPPVAGMYFTVEEGTATVSVSATSAVVTSTLKSAAPSSTGAPSASGSSAPNSSSNAALTSTFVNLPLALVAFVVGSFVL
ncbi:PEBP-like protein [Artomyces pyxidatus]|uniref:PEBP-like protein n=1 Tax=Artomyces pyxidatus TaxID=48021 RepID=A0ACB8SY09_9AGAM|nr:PEBP-like protein [Artomyces pyxidatus]